MRTANANETWSYCGLHNSIRNGYTATGASVSADIGTNYEYGSGTAGKTNIDNLTQDFTIPKVSFANNQVTITRGGSHNSMPMIWYQKRIRDSSGTVTGGGDYVVLWPGQNRNPTCTCQLTTISSGATSTLNPWFEDDNNLIAGRWLSKSTNNCYVVTFKQGTYAYSADWYDKTSTVWTFDFQTPRIIKTTKKLSAVINDLLL